MQRELVCNVHVNRESRPIEISKRRRSAHGPCLHVTAWLFWQQLPGRSLRLPLVKVPGPQFRNVALWSPTTAPARLKLAIHYSHDTTLERRISVSTTLKGYTKRRANNSFQLAPTALRSPRLDNKHADVLPSPRLELPGSGLPGPLLLP